MKLAGWRAGGLDGLVFTTGIGENAPAIRAAVCERLGWLGLRMDAGANATNASCISASDSKVAIHVIATNEEAMIARHTRGVHAKMPPPEQEKPSHRNTPHPIKS